MWFAAIFLLAIQPAKAELALSPVFVIDYEKILSNIVIPPNPFLKMTSPDFSSLVIQAINRAKVVILFVEETFCTEDISTKDKHGSPFYHLSQALREKRVKYLPSVYNPMKTIKSLLKPLSNYIFHISDSSSKLQIYDSNLKHFYIYFNDNYNETRSFALRRHDLLIKEIYFVVRQIAAGPVVAFYTGKYNPISLNYVRFMPVKMQKARQRPGVMIQSGGALFRFVDVYAMTSNRRSMFSQIPLVEEESWEENGLVTRISYTDFELEFTFRFEDDRWIMENVALLEWGEEVGKTGVNIGAPWDWSYMCSEPLTLINLRDGSAITISHYQIQPFNFKQYMVLSSGLNSSNSTNDTRCFGPAVNCGPFFNAHILAGLMVTYLCLGILFYGVGSLYNVRSNDRYDDPQAKPLVIVAEGGGH